MCLYPFTENSYFPISTDDSDVDLIQVRQDVPERLSPSSQGAEGQTRRSLSGSHQPIVHFDGAVREPASPQEYDVHNELPKELSNPKVYVCFRLHIRLH